MRTLCATLSVILASACGANEGAGAPRSEPAPEVPPREAAAPPEAEPAPAEEPAPEPPPAPEPVDVEAGTRLGPIRVGMSEADVRALGLAEAVLDPRTTSFGPYQVTFREGVVRRVAAQIGALGRVRIGERVIAAGAHIAEIRDAFGDCTWTEGGGERYVCADGTLFVHTTHSMDPQRYTLGVEGR